MSTPENEDTTGQKARRCLAEGVATLTGSALERRHEVLMEWAEAELGLPREYAEQVYTLAEEEELEPVLGLLLVRCGIGVRELDPPEPDADAEASQQTPPGWIQPDSVELDDIMLERRLRASFRRLRTHVAGATGPAAGVDAFLAEDDIGPTRLR